MKQFFQELIVGSPSKKDITATTILLRATILAVSMAAIMLLLTGLLYWLAITI